MSIPFGGEDDGFPAQSVTCPICGAIYNYSGAREILFARLEDGTVWGICVDGMNRRLEGARRDFAIARLAEAAAQDAASQARDREKLRRWMEARR